jgi:hypothetical protein
MADKDRRIPRPQVPAGDYTLEYLDHWHHRQKEGLKLVIVFVIAEGDYKGLEIARCYNVKKGNEKRPWSITRSYDLYAEFCAVMHGHLDTNRLRLDELPINKMKGLRITARVRLIKKNRAGVPLVGAASYSVVKNLLGSESARSERQGSNSSLAKPSLSLTPTPTPTLTPTPTRKSPREDRVRLSEDAMGKNGGSDGETSYADADKRSNALPSDRIVWND